MKLWPRCRGAQCAEMIAFEKGEKRLIKGDIFSGASEQRGAYLLGVDFPLDGGNSLRLDSFNLRAQPLRQAKCLPRGLWKHVDVIKWKHFPRHWPFVRGIHRSPVNSPHKGQWRGALMFSLNKRFSKSSRRSWFETPSRSLWRHSNEGCARRRLLVAFWKTIEIPHVSPQCIATHLLRIWVNSNLSLLPANRTNCNLTSRGYVSNPIEWPINSGIRWVDVMTGPRVRRPVAD